MTGGRYIGELIRIVLFDFLTAVVGLTKKELPAALVQEYALSTTFVSNVVARSRSDEELAKQLGRSLPPPESSEWSWDADNAQAFRRIARTVQTRSAQLIAAAVVGLLASTGEIQLKDDSARNTPPPTSGDTVPPSNAKVSADSNSARVLRGPIVPVLAVPQADWHSGPEELVVAYTGGIIQNYPHFKEICQAYIDRLIIRTGPQKGGKSVFLREASDGGVIGAGVLAGMVVGHSDRA
jgi:hexokinase